MGITAWLTELRTRNEVLFYFGLVCIVSGILFLGLTRISKTTLDDVNIWYKPFKFAMSIGVYCWTMGWLCSYLNSFNVTFFNWFIVAALGFEIVYIALQAARGQRSHFNMTSQVYVMLYGLMAIAATAVTVYTGYVGVKFLSGTFAGLPDYYVTAIRWSILIFVIFSLEGFVMGSRLSHTIGGPDGNHGMPIVNWSRKFGDPRVAHFIGMHALQLLPLAAYYVLKSNLAVHIAAIVYLLLAAATLVQALSGRPLIPLR